MSEFTCAMCNRTFERMNNEEWNEDKARKEFIDTYPEYENDETDLICDDCNKDFMKWFSTLSEEEKKHIRENYEALE